MSLEDAEHLRASFEMGKDEFALRLVGKEGGREAREQYRGCHEGHLRPDRCHAYAAAGAAPAVGRRVSQSRRSTWPDCQVTKANQPRARGREASLLGSTHPRPASATSCRSPPGL